MLETETRYFEENQDKWKQESVEKFVLIKGTQAVGFFGTLEDALNEGARRFGLSPFLARSVYEGRPEVRIPALALGVLQADNACADEMLEKVSWNEGGGADANL